MTAQQNSALDRSGSRALETPGDDVNRHALDTTRVSIGKANTTAHAAKAPRRRDAAACGRVHRALWMEQAFRALPAPPPNARTLLLRLLTGPEASTLPGVVLVGEAALAEKLAWSLDDMRRCWREVEAAGYATADWSAGLVWVPGALDDNPPASPNVVRSWRARWAAVPDCPLKLRVYSELEAFAQGLGKAFGEAFEEAFGEALPDAFVDGANTRHGDDIDPAQPPAVAPPAPSGARLAPPLQNQRREKREEKTREEISQRPGATSAPASGVFKLSAPKPRGARKELVERPLVEAVWGVWRALWSRLYAGTYRRSPTCPAALERVVLAAREMALEEANRRHLAEVPAELVVEAARAILVSYIERADAFVCANKHPLRLALQNLHAVRAPWECRRPPAPRVEAPPEPPLEGAAAEAAQRALLEQTAAFAQMRVAG